MEINKIMFLITNNGNRLYVKNIHSPSTPATPELSSFFSVSFQQYRSGQLFTPYEGSTAVSRCAGSAVYGSVEVSVPV